jgi:ketosteroid isomerase-like protein
MQNDHLPFENAIFAKGNLAVFHADSGLQCNLEVRSILFPPGGSLMYRPPSSSASGSNPLLDVESTIRGLTQDFCMAFNTGNYDQAGALFASDGVLMLSHRESAQGPNGIERLLRLCGDAGYQNLRFETTRVDYSGDMAIEMGRYTVSIELGNTMVADAGKFLRAWHRLGAWRIVGDSWNSSLPAAHREIKDREIKLGEDAKVA